MFLNRRIVICLICALLPVNTVQPSPQKNQTQDMVIRVNVQLVQVDVTVTNSKDEHVTDLKADDFIILQDDKPQDISNFSFVQTRSAVKTAIAPKSPVLNSQKTTAPPPPPPLKREKVHRTIALVVDDLGLSFEGIWQVQKAAKKWIDEEMQSDDLVAITLTGGGSALQQFTNAKRMLYAAVENIHYNGWSRVGVTSLSGISAPPDEVAMHKTILTLQSIRQVVNALKDLPGRKDAIIFSESMHGMFGKTPQESLSRDQVIKQMYQDTVDLANKWAVVFHTIDPRGVMGFMSAEDSFSGMQPEDIANVSNRRSEQLTLSRFGMVKMAVETGGLFVQNRNNTERALVAVVEDGDGYYLIGYQPDEKTVAEMKSGKAKYHNIRVRVKLPGLHVRTRSRFFSTPEILSSPDPLVRKDRIEDAMQSPFASGSIRVRLTALFSQTTDENLCINALLHFDASQLSFSNEPEDWHKTNVEIIAGLYDIEGQQVEFADKEWSLQIKGQSFENAKQNGASFLLRLPVKNPGSYQMRVVLRDTVSGRLGSVPQFIEVPDIGKKKLALSGIVLAAEQSMAKTAADQSEGIMENSGSNGTAAVRVFEPGTSISWAYQILNAKIDKDQKAKLQIQYRLFYEGREVFANKPLEITPASSGAISKRMIAADHMTLKQLPPGYYVLQIAVSDMLADEKNQQAVQSIDFEVREPIAGGKN
jgi:VWFA-related protein